jgi:hypothetical protein
VIDRGKNLVTHPASITFDISGHITKISLLKDLVGRSGYLRLTHLAIHSYEEEDYLLFSAFTDDGQSIDQETSEKLFSCSASVAPLTQIPEKHSERLIAESRRHIEATISKSLDRNNVHFKQACESIDRWADDIVLAAELKLQQAKAEIRALRTRMRQAETLEEQQQAQEDIRLAEKRKRKARREIDDIEEQTEEKRESLIACLESRLSQKTIPTELFTIHFSVI